MADTQLPTADQLIPSTEFGSVPQAGQLQSTGAYKNVREVDKFCFMEHTFDGSAGYRDCSYLTPTDREMFYETRRGISYYVNVFRPIVNAMVDPVFNQPITRTTNNALFEQFITNCDNAGTSLQVFMKNALKNARLYSCNFIVMDNFQAQEVEPLETEEQLAQNRKFPYIYEKNPQQVKEHETNAHGALTSITFYDRVEEVEENGKKEIRQYYREWDAQTWELYYCVKNGSEEVEVEVESGTHGLGIIPVIPIVDFATSASLKELPWPELYDIAFLSFGLFNKESQVCFMEIMQTFAILCTSGMGTSAKAIGPATFLDSGTDSKYPPQYVAPPQDGIKTLIENCERLKEEIRTQAQQKGVVAVKEAASGIAKEWDFRAEEAVLKATAQAGERVETVLSEIFGLYINAIIAYDVEYPYQFSPTADNDDIKMTLEILKETPPRPIAEKLWMDIARRRWKNDAQVLNDIEAALKSEADESAAIEAMRKEMPIGEMSE